MAALGTLGASGLEAADAPKPAPVAATPAAPAATSWVYSAQELAIPSGKPAAYIPEEMRRMFKVVDDPDAKGGKALQVTVDQRLIREHDIPVVNTPPLHRKEAGVGVYKVTVRMKITGMLNVIGTSIRFTSKELSAGADKHGEPTLERYWEPTIHGFMFKDADAYQEFSYLTEVIEPDDETLRPEREKAETALGNSPPSKPQMLKEEAGPTPQEIKQKQEIAARNAENARKQFENGALSSHLALLQVITKGFGRSRNSIQVLTVDTIKIERVPDPASATVRQVLPQKMWLRPGDSQVFHVWMHNRSGKAQSGELHLKITHGLDEEIEVGKQPVNIEPGKYSITDVPWTAPKGEDLWGCAVTAEFVQDGKPASSAQEYFSVHTNPWAVMNFGGSNRNANPFYEYPDYRNFQEFFGVTPGDSLKPFPDDPSVPYFTGMSNYMTIISRQKHIADHNRALGIATFMYLSPNATSHLTEEAYAKHPEWFGGRINWTDMANDLWTKNTAEMVKRWTEGKAQPGNQDPEAYHFYHIEQLLNDFYDEVFNIKLDGVLKDLRYVGYDGVRWDGDPFTVMSGSYTGQTFGTGKSETDIEMSAKRVTQFKEAVRKEFPSYTEGANGVIGRIGPTSYNRKLTPPPIESNPPFMAFLKDGSSIMDEGWMNAYIFNDPRNTIKDYFWGCRQEVDACRRAGGFLHTFTPQRDTTPYFTQSIIYYNHLVALAGAQYPGYWGCSPTSESGLSQFLTRYSEFLFDNKLMWMKDAPQQIRVDGAAPNEPWWDETVVSRDLPDGKRRICIPMINPPTVDRFLRDQFSELPEPIKDPFAVEVKVPEGFKSAKVYMLSDEPMTSCTPLNVTIDSGTARFEVPKLNFFCVLVVEFEK